MAGMIGGLLFIMREHSLEKERVGTRCGGAVFAFLAGVRAEERREQASSLLYIWRKRMLACKGRRKVTAS